MRKKSASWYIALSCAVLLVFTPVAVIFVPDVTWNDVGWAMCIWATVGVFTALPNLAKNDKD